MISLDLELPTDSFVLRVALEMRERVTAILGPSGSGKSSLVEAIAGLRPLSRGRISVGGALFLDSTSGVNLPPERRRVGFVPQDGALFPHLDVRRNIGFAGRDPERLALLARTLDIEPLLDRMPSKLSGGERQRVAIARALMMRPRILLLDEPLAGVDLERRNRIIAALRRIRAAFDVPMVYVTHFPLEALALADEAVVLEEGAVVARGAVREVLRRDEFGGSHAADNLLEVDHPRISPERGVIEVRTREGMSLSVPIELGEDADWPMLIRVSGDDVVVFRNRPEATSARNLLDGEITAMTESAGHVDLDVATPTPLRVRITTASARDLQLRPGGRVWLALRTRSIHRVG